MTSLGFLLMHVLKLSRGLSCLSFEWPKGYISAREIGSVKALTMGRKGIMKGYKMIGGKLEVGHKTQKYWPLASAFVFKISELRFESNRRISPRMSIVGREDGGEL
jgi:hypothetical protein